MLHFLREFQILTQFYSNQTRHVGIWNYNNNKCQQVIDFFIFFIFINKIFQS